MPYDVIEFPDGATPPKPLSKSLLDKIAKEYGTNNLAEWTTTPDATPHLKCNSAAEVAAKSEAFKAKLAEWTSKIEHEMWASLIGNANIARTCGPHRLRGGLPIPSPTHDYLCPDCLAIVHDESGVPECTGWPKAMQHARRFMEPFGGEI